MLLVPQHILDDVMKRKASISIKVDETDNASQSTAFGIICKKADQEYASTTQLDAYHSKGQLHAFKSKMLGFLKKNKDIVRYVGNGSSRITFAMADGTALKLAFTQSGIQQNKHEAKICMNPELRYAIFPEFYAVDSKHWLLLNCELCSPGHEQMFYDLFGCSLNDAIDVIEFIVSLELHDNELMSVYGHYVKAKAFGCADFAKRIAKPLREADKAMHSLIQFYRDYGKSELVIGDLRNPENWGYTVRNGQSTMLVIDAGLDNAISQMYYSSVQ